VYLTRLLYCRLPKCEKTANQAVTGTTPYVAVGEAARNLPVALQPIASDARVMPFELMERFGAY